MAGRGGEYTKRPTSDCQWEAGGGGGGREEFRALPGYTGYLYAGFYIISLERGGSCNPYTRRLPAGGPTKEEAQNWGAANTAQFFGASQWCGLTHQQLGRLDLRVGAWGAPVWPPAYLTRGIQASNTTEEGDIIVCHGPRSTPFI